MLSHAYLPMLAACHYSTVEQIYQKKTQLEHILLRPDTYIGSTESVSQNMWVFDEATEKMVNR
jgi:DNA topoisomerase-2